MEGQDTFKGKEDTVYPKLLARLSTLLTLLTGTNFDLFKLIFKSETVSKHKNKALRWLRFLGLPHQMARRQPQLEAGKYEAYQCSYTAPIYSGK